MHLTKNQKKLLAIVREYGGMKADMLKKLCGEPYGFDVMLRQLTVNRMLFKMGEYYCDDCKMICGRDTETAFEVMLAVADPPPEIYCRGQPPFELTFFKDRKDRLYRYDICVAHSGREAVINALSEGIDQQCRVVILAVDSLRICEYIRIPCEKYICLKENGEYRFYKGGKSDD